MFPGAATEAHIAVPTKRTNAQTRSDASCGPLQVGMVVVIGDGIDEVSSICTGVSYLVKRYGSVVHLVHGSGVKLVHLLPGQAVEPVVGPRMLSQVDTLLGRTLNLGGFGLGEVALSIQSPDNLKRFLSLMVLLQRGRRLVGGCGEY